MPRNPVTEGLRGARSARARYGMGPLQPADPFEIAEADGMVVVRRPLQAIELSGVYYYHEGLARGFALINGAHPESRQRFTMAHELGHHHFDRRGGLFVDESTIDSGLAVERRANAFAAELLLPEKAVLAWRPSAPWGERADDVARLAIHYGASYDAALFRLYTAKLLTWEQMERSRDRSSLDEPLRAKLAEGRLAATAFPEEFLALAAQAYERGIISRKRYAELIETPAEELA